MDKSTAGSPEFLLLDLFRTQKGSMGTKGMHIYLHECLNFFMVNVTKYTIHSWILWGSSLQEVDDVFFHCFGMFDDVGYIDTKAVMDDRCI